MRWLVLLALVGCKGKPADGVDWNACEAALAQSDATAIVHACRVCDTAPILDWQKPHAQGGPTHQQIDAAMVSCKAFCTPDAKQKFMGTLDDARDTSNRRPWRLLGESCKADVSAVPDTRYMSATYFVLDRIARAAAAHGTDLSKTHVVLPPVTITGVGLALPIAQNLKPAPAQVLSLIEQPYLGTLPSATLGKTGLAVSGAYPGTAVALDGLHVTGPVAILAGRAAPAIGVFDALASIDRGAFLAADPAASQDFIVPGVIDVEVQAVLPPRPDGPPTPPGMRTPIPLSAKPPRDRPYALVIGDTDTVQNLADALARAAAAGVRHMDVVSASARPVGP